MGRGSFLVLVRKGWVRLSAGAELKNASVLERAMAVCNDLRGLNARYKNGL